MKNYLLVPAVMFLLLCGSMINELQAQPEFATVRLVTSWGNNSNLFITKGQGPIERVELNQRYTDKKQEKDLDADNKIINSVFAALYGDGFKLVSTAARNHPGGGFVSAGSEITYLLVKE
jgi:hypothetical protein